MSTPTTLTPQALYDARLPFAQAWREGKEVQIEYVIGVWTSIPSTFNVADFFVESNRFRFPPTPTYRAWTGPHEVPIGAVFRSRDDQGLWRVPTWYNNFGIAFLNGVHYTYKELLNDYEWSKDGVTWTECGAKEGDA